MNKTVKFSNKLNQIILKGMTVLQKKLWWSLVAELSGRDCEIFEVHRLDIYELSGYSKMNRSISQFKKDLRDTLIKVAELNPQYAKENKKLTLFDYKINDDEVLLRLNAETLPIFNADKQFTAFHTETLTQFKSGYSNNFYRLIMQYKKTGLLFITMEEFRKLMNIPDSYKMNNIDQRVFNVVKNELLIEDKDGYKALEKLSIEKFKGNRRNNKITHLTIRFKACEPKLTEKSKLQEKTLTVKEEIAALIQEMNQGEEAEEQKNQVVKEVKASKAIERDRKKAYSQTPQKQKPYQKPVAQKPTPPKPEPIPVQSQALKDVLEYNSLNLNEHGLIVRCTIPLDPTPVLTQEDFLSLEYTDFANPKGYWIEARAHGLVEIERQAFARVIEHMKRKAEEAKEREKEIKRQSSY